MHTFNQKEAADFLNTILASTTEYSIILKDLQGHILTWNEGAKNNYGYTTNEVIGKHSSILSIPEDIESGRLDQFFSQALQLGKVEEIFERKRKNGEQFTAVVTMTLRRNDTGQPTGYILISKNITDQKKLEMQLRIKNIELEQQNLRIQQVNRLKSEFLANMSHELRTPLNAIIGFADLMHSEKLGAVTESHKEYLHDILTSSNHLLQLINDILDLSKIEAGKMEFNAQSIDVSKVITEVKNILLSVLSKKRIQFNIHIAPEVKFVILDLAKLKQVLYNLISNAIKFSYDDSKIMVTVKAIDKQYFCIQVKDEGIGISKNDLENLFVEFQQLDSSTKKRYQGTGLGLALTKKIVEAQGGQVGVESQLNKGSTFYIILPKQYIVNSDQKPLLTKKKFAHPSTPAILLIDDDTTDCNFIKNILNQAGYIVDIAEYGSEGLQLIQSRSYDCILLDLFLPDMSGLDILENLRTDKLNINTPVIISTVVADKSICKKYSIHDFLTKPIEQKTLLDSLKRLHITPYFSPSILVVDDNLQDLQLAKAVLDQTGYQVVCESNVEKALNHAFNTKPNTIILDLLMPDMNGFDFLQKLRNNKQNMNTIVIIWTAKDLNEDELEQLRHSAQTVVLKGKDSTDILLSKIKHYSPISFNEKLH